MEFSQKRTALQRFQQIFIVLLLQPKTFSRLNANYYNLVMLFHSVSVIAMLRFCLWPGHLFTFQTWKHGSMTDSSFVLAGTTCMQKTLSRQLETQPYALEPNFKNRRFSICIFLEESKRKSGLYLKQNGLQNIILSRVFCGLFNMLFQDMISKRSEPFKFCLEGSFAGNQILRLVHK